MKLREIRESDFEFFAKYARAEDVAECLSVSNKPLAEHIRIGKELSLESFALVDNKDRPCALYGLMRDASGHYVPWLLTTVFVDKHKLSFMKQTQKEVRRWYQKYGKLWLLTDLRYEGAVKLNLWVGFKQLGKPILINSVKFGLFVYDEEYKDGE